MTARENQTNNMNKIEEKKRCEYELYLEKYFGIPFDDKLVLNNQMGLLADLLCGFSQEVVNTDGKQTKYKEIV